MVEAPKGVRSHESRPLAAALSERKVSFEVLEGLQGQENQSRNQRASPRISIGYSKKRRIIFLVGRDQIQLLPA